MVDQGIIVMQGKYGMIPELKINAPIKINIILNINTGYSSSKYDLYAKIANGMIITAPITANIHEAMVMQVMILSTSLLLSLHPID